MVWLPIVVGIIIGYMIYQKRRLTAESDSYADEGYQFAEETGHYTYRTHDVQNTHPQTTCSADEYREINEAVTAGERALDSLKTAKSKLDSARAWGIYDILGGGLISSVIKHGQIDNANEWMEQANHDLRKFAKELRDVPGEYLHVQTGDLISMLDIFCDNFFSDIMHGLIPNKTSLFFLSAFIIDNSSFILSILLFMHKHIHIGMCLLKSRTSIH